MKPTRKYNNMKTTRNLLMAGMVAAFCCSIANAQIIYSNNFSLGAASDINGTAPTMAYNYAGGSSSATWSDALGIHDTNATGAVYFGANGSVPGTPDSLLLPFTPQSGYVYTLIASLTFSGNPGNWVGLGFAQNYSTNALYGYGRFSDTGNGGPNGQDWMIATESSGNVQTFYSRNGQHFSQNGFFTAAGAPETLSLEVVLDTTTTLWTMAQYINGVQAGTTYTYTANPTIGSVGLTETTMGAPTDVQWNNIMLTATPVPEPSALALTGAGLTTMVLVSLYRRRRNAARETSCKELLDERY
jgi:hypothetical protein